MPLVFHRRPEVEVFREGSRIEHERTQVLSNASRHNEKKTCEPGASKKARASGRFVSFDGRFSPQRSHNSQRLKTCQNNALMKAYFCVRLPHTAGFARERRRRERENLERLVQSRGTFSIFHVGEFHESHEVGSVL